MPPVDVAGSAWNLVLARAAAATTGVYRPAADDCDGGGAAGDLGRTVAENVAQYPRAGGGGGDDVGDG